MPSPLAPLLDELRDLRPDGAEAIDAHTHLGVDEDGRSLAPDELLGALDEAGIARACVFPLHDPERSPSYRVPNDRVIGWAGESGGRLVPFCRLDPADDPLREAERCLARGARGMKLHPRAQSFAFADGMAAGIFARAEETGVPVLVHAGRGMPPIAEGLVAAALRHPGLVLILAHAGIADQALFASSLAEHPGVLYDTSTFSAVDIRSLLARVPAERIVFGSDPPYGVPRWGLYVTLRACAAAGLDPAAAASVTGGTMGAVLDGRPLPDPTAPRGGEALTLPAPLLRVYGYGCLAFGAILSGRPADAGEGIALALSACRDPSSGEAGAVLHRLAPLLESAARELVRPEGLDDAIQLLYLATAVAATEPCA